tara:strand:+ start:1000 stop:1581 length:582 start_codon:yes stop_codon:yes gene_type:complete
MGYKYKIKELEIGDITTDSGVQSTVSDIDPETGTISWDVDYVPAFDSTFKEFQELRQYLNTLARKTNDTVIDQLSDNVNKLFNQYRTHLRKNYSDEYQKMGMNEEEVDEMSMSGGAGAYLTPYAFRIPKKKKKKIKENKPQNPGATLGPGPAASEDGVKDNAYVKQFKYQLVPKDKNGNYVQKGSGLEVKNLF